VTDRPYSRHRADTDVNQSIVVLSDTSIYGHNCVFFLNMSNVIVIIVMTYLHYTTDMCDLMKASMIDWSVPKMQ